LSLHLILYSKPGCHLCEGLQEKLTQIKSFDLVLDVRDITTRDDWFQVYQYEVPVLVLVKEKRSQESGVRSQEAGKAAERAEEAGEAGEAEAGGAFQSLELKTSSLIPLPRPSPRATVQQLEQMLRRYL
jgi:hypothetical protein